jgi:hypothetical protein
MIPHPLTPVNMAPSLVITTIIFVACRFFIIVLSNTIKCVLHLAYCTGCIHRVPMLPVWDTDHTTLDSIHHLADCPVHLYKLVDCLVHLYKGPWISITPYTRLYKSTCLFSSRPLRTRYVHYSTHSHVSAFINLKLGLS